MLSRILHSVDTLARFGAGVSGLFLATICLLMAAEVLARYLLNTDLPFAWEYSSYLMSAAFFLAAAYTLRTGAHIRLGLLQIMPWTKLRAAAEVGATLAGLAVALLVAWSLVDSAWQAYLRDARSYTPMETPLAIPKAVSGLGAALLCLQMLARLVAACTGRPLEETPRADTLWADR